MSRKINKDLIDRLSPCEYICEVHNVIILDSGSDCKNILYN
jgi:hypothetical protein